MIRDARSAPSPDGLDLAYRINVMPSSVYTVQYAVQHVPDSYAARVQNFAVLYPLTKYCRSPWEIEQSTFQLIEDWRRRLAVLVHRGWQPSAGQHGGLNGRNCCPTFAYMLPRTRPCNLRSICPFCYAREAGKVWEMAQYAFHGEMPGPVQWYRPGCPDPLPPWPERPPPVCRFQLVERYIKFMYPYVAPGCDPNDQQAQDDVLFSLLDQLADSRGKAVGAHKAYGAYQATTIEAGRRGWRIRTRQLLMYSSAKDLPKSVLEPAANRTIRVHPKPTRRELCDAVTRVCRYPRLLMVGNPLQTARLLEARRLHRVRLVATYGAFRGLANA